MNISKIKLFYFFFQRSLNHSKELHFGFISWARRQALVPPTLLLKRLSWSFMPRTDAGESGLDTHMPALDSQ